MNAYELAKLLDFDAETLNWKAFKDAANMLRQQADRIAELEELLKIDGDEIKILQSLLKEKQSEPVAWMEYIQGEEWEVWYVEPTDLPEGHTYKPLYLAPQTKPLSDEEIIAMADSLSLIHYYDSDGEWSGITNEPMFRAEQNRNNERLLEILKPFARAIEERHGIK